MCLCARESEKEADKDRETERARQTETQKKRARAKDEIKNGTDQTWKKGGRTDNGMQRDANRQIKEQRKGWTETDSRDNGVRETARGSYRDGNSD